MFKNFKEYTIFVTCILLFISNFAKAKDTFDIELAGFYERSRLARSSETSSNFSLNSNSGWRGRLEFELYLAKWFILTGAGEYASYVFEGSTVRVINEPEPTTVTAEGGFRFRFGDFQLFFLYQNMPLMILVDQSANEHDIKIVNTPMGIGGFRFGAVSRYWDLAFEARGGTALGEVEFEDNTLKHQYFISGTAMMIFGRTNKTLFEVISLKNVLGSESLYGLKATMREDQYKYGDDEYILSSFYAGAFLRFVF